VAGSRSACLRRALVRAGVPVRVAELAASRWKESTAGTYDSGWFAWSGFCSDGGADPVCLDIPALARWLTSLFDQNLAAATLNGYRSAVIGVWELVHSRSGLASSPLLAAIIAAAKIQRPPTPRYDTIWDIGLVVAYWLAHPPSPSDPPLRLRERALTLFLAATFQRPSDASRVVESAWSVHPDPPAVGFRVRGPKDHRNRVGALTPPHFLPLLPADHALYDACAGRALQAYRDRVAPLRCPLSGEFTFLSEKRGSTQEVKHFFPLGAKRVASVAKAFLVSALGLTAFGGASFRHAGATGALRGGVAVSDIMAKGRWRSYSTYAKWYERAASLGPLLAAQRAAAEGGGPAAGNPLPAFVPLPRRDPHPVPPGRGNGRGRGRGGRPGRRAAPPPAL